MNKNITIGILATAILVSGFFWVAQPSKTVEITKDGPVKLGSAEIAHPYIKWGDVEVWHSIDRDLTDSASTTCSFLNPTAATSTVSDVMLRLSTGFQGATMQVEAGKATNNAYATTTSLGIGIFPSFGQGTFTASTTSYTAIDGPLVFGPNDYLNFKVGTTTANIEGICQATWTVSR